jgi:hypothetical protein
MFKNYFLPEVLIILLWGFIIPFVHAQNPDKDTIQESILNHYDSPELDFLSTHPLGLFISRIQGNFSMHPPEKPVFSLHISNGNVWLPLVKSYRPRDPDVRNLMAGIVWHGRWNTFKLSEMPSDSIQFKADGVIRGLRINSRFRISDKQELRISIRSFLVSKGQFPFSVWTNDRVIESFHSKIAGGNDPFARKYYGFDKAYIRYTDEAGRSLELGNGDFLVPGFETSYYYYPDFLKDKNFFLNGGAHLGINISKYNPSIDVGLSATSIKIIPISLNRSFNIGIGLSALKQKLIKTGEVVNFSNRKFIFSAEGQLEYHIQGKNNAIIIAGINYSVQSPYNTEAENKYQVLTGNRISTHWHYAISHLYRPLEAWNLFFSYSKNNTVSVYLKEDFNVNNAPDVQTGINFQVPVGKLNPRNKL